MRPLILTLAHAVLCVAFSFGILGTRLGLVFSIGLLARLGAALAETFASRSLPLMGDGDAQGFYLAAIGVSQDLSTAGQTYGQLYTGLVGYLFAAIGTDPLPAHYLNVLLGTTAVAFLGCAFAVLQTPLRVASWWLLIAALFPSSVLFSGDLLREAIVLAPLSLSLFLFLGAFVQGKVKWYLPCLVAVIVASMFHAGSIAVALGYALVVALVNPATGRLSLRPWKILGTGVAGAVAILVMLQFPELLLDKFASVESEADILSRANFRDGGAAYLTNLQANDFGSVLLYAPLRAIYFLLSPMPWDWRGFIDTAAFGLDSLLYLVAGSAVFFALRRRGEGRSRAVVVGLVLIVGVASLVFGLGTFNSGTAMRHRGKLLMFVVLMAATALTRGSVSSPQREATRGRRSPLRGARF